MGSVADSNFFVLDRVAEGPNRAPNPVLPLHGRKAENMGKTPHWGIITHPNPGCLQPETDRFGGVRLVSSGSEPEFTTIGPETEEAAWQAG